MQSKARNSPSAAPLNKVNPSVLEWLLVWTAVALAIWIFITTIHLACAGWVVVPVADDWDRWLTYIQDGYSLKWFFLQHVDHRLAAPKVLFAIDHLVFHARAWFLQVCALCFQALTAALLWRLAGRVCPQHTTERLVQAAFFVACLFAGQQWMNFIRLFQVQFPMVYFFAAATFWAMWKGSESDREHEGRWLAVSIAAATLSLFSMANGILVWPVMILTAVWLRMSIQRIAAIAAGMIILGVLYFHGWRQSTTRVSWKGLPRAMLFFLDHLGSPMGFLPRLHDTTVPRETVVGIIGALLGLALLMAFVNLWRRRERFNSAQAVLLFFCVFLAVTSAGMAYGRYDAPASEQFAFNSRYLTPAYILWAAMLAATWPYLRRVNRVALYAVLCAFLYFGLGYGQKEGLDIARLWTGMSLQAEAGIADQVIDPDPWRILYHTPGLTISAINYLKANRLTLFTEEWTRWPGTPLSPHFSIDRNPGVCQGQIDETLPISSAEPGWRITGWAWDAKAGQPPRFIVLADESGQVAGVALIGLLRAPGLPPIPPQYAAASTWVGYVNGEPRRIIAYVLEDDNRSLCPIGTTDVESQTRQAGLLELGPQLPYSVPEIIGSWIPDGYFKGAGGPGAPIMSGPVFGSYPPDAATGTIRLGPFHLNAGDRIAIPLVTGPDNHKLSVAVRDTGTRIILTELKPAVLHTAWWLWRPDLPQGRELNVEVLAEDEGAGFGQWQAIGWPHLLLDRPVREAAFTELGARLADSTPQITGAWVQDGYYKGAGGPGAPPVDGAVFGSYPDAATGTIRLGPFHLDGRSQMAIPLVSGPNNHGLSVVLRDPISKAVLVELEPSPIHTTWWVWLPDLPQGREFNVEIFAEDKGTGWGQWQAVAWPHLTRH